MKKLSKKYLTVAAITLGIIGACSLAWSTAYPSGKWHYKITVNIETPEGLRTGSVIRGISAMRQPSYANTSGVTGAYGEALVVD